MSALICTMDLFKNLNHMKELFSLWGIMVHLWTCLCLEYMLMSDSLLRGGIDVWVSSPGIHSRWTFMNTLAICGSSEFDLEP